MHIEDLSKAMFYEDCILQQFVVRKNKVRRPMGIKFRERYTVSTIKHLPKQIVWGDFPSLALLVVVFYSPEKAQ